MNIEMKRQINVNKYKRYNDKKEIRININIKE